MDKNKRICEQGHVYYKSSDCPVCPICERERHLEDGFLSKLSAPARRALERARIETLEDLAKHSEDDLLQLHGLGPSSLPKLKASLQEKGLAFKKDNLL